MSKLLPTCPSDNFVELFLCFFSKFVLRFGRLAKHFLTFDKIAVAVLSEMKFMLLEDLFEEKRFLLKFAFFYIFCWIWQKSFRPIGKSFFSPSFSKWHSTFEGEQLNESWKLPLLKKIILSKSFSEFEWKTFDFLGKIYWQDAGLSNSQSAYLNEFFETNSFENIVNIIFTLKLRAKLFWTSSGKKDRVEETSFCVSGGAFDDETFFFHYNWCLFSIFRRWKKVFPTSGEIFPACLLKLPSTFAEEH